MDIPRITIFDSETMAAFFQNAGSVLYFIMPVVLVFAAVYYAQYLISVITSVFNFFRKNSSEDEFEYEED